VSYCICYLGVTRLLLVLARQVATVGLVFAFIINAFLITVGALGPFLFQLWLFNYSESDYTELQITNWFWTLLECMRGDITGHPVALISVFGAAFVIFAANLVQARREIGQVRLAAPQRVQEEEAARHPQAKVKSSPWDDEPAEAFLPPGT
jgi:hypothetical protein